MWSRVPAPLRWALGASAGAASWTVLQPLIVLTPTPARFLCGWLLFTGGPGLAATAVLTRGDSRLRRLVLALAAGAAGGAVLVDVLGRLGSLAAFPWIALGLGGGALASQVGRSRATSAADRLAAGVLLVLALGTGAIAFSHRVADDYRGLRVYGDYDSLDLGYYGSITAEAAHTVPPTAPYYAGRGLNYAYYPQLVPAMLHRSLAVPVVDMYFRYLWPTLLALAALTGFVFVGGIASRRAACVSMALLLVGGDLSYVAAWALPHDNLDWDYLLWPTNFLSPTMEVLHFNSWTPSLPLFFGVLIAATEAVRTGRVSWAVLGGLLLATLFQFKPFAFLVLAGAMTLVWLQSWRRRDVARLYFVTLATAAVGAVPFAIRAAALYADRRSELRVAFFLLPQRMLIKLDLAETFERAAASVTAIEPLAHALVVAAATALFLAGGLGIRWLGVPALVRAARGRAPGGLAPEPWRLLAWVAIVGVATPFIVVTEPYHDTLQFHQTGLYALWVFTGTMLAAWAGPGAARGAVAAVALAACSLPSSIHYLARKWQDQTRPPLVVLDAATRSAVAYLMRQDPTTTVILHDRPLEPSLVPVVAGRRVVLAWARYAVGSDDRRRDVDTFYNSADGTPADALDILRRYAVTHVLVRPSRARVHPDVLAQLQPILRLEDLTLYAVPTGLGQ